MKVLGLDIGGTKCAVTVCSAEKGSITVLEKKVFKTDTTVPCDKMLAEYYPTMHLFIEKYNCESIGISSGGPLNSGKGVIVSPPNLPNFVDFPIVSVLEAEFKIPAFLQNDANACALAEWLFGAGKGTENMVFLTFGTGLGAGLILNGRLYEGTNGNAGEVGHIRLSENGPIGFGKAGSFEGFCSGGGLAQLGKALGEKTLKNGEKPLYYGDNSDGITAKTIAEAAIKGDKTALEVYRIGGKYLGKGLSVLIDILNPERIVIGSIFTRSGELLREAMEKELDIEALDVSTSVCEIVPAALDESLGDYAAATVAVWGKRESK